MKNKVLLVVLILMALSMLSCSSSNNDKSNPFDVAYEDDSNDNSELAGLGLAGLGLLGDDDDDDTDTPCTGCQTCSASIEPANPWTVTATSVPWLTSNPFNSKHDGGWVYSPCEDVLYAMYGQDNQGKYLYRIDHIGETSTVATTFSYDRHGAHPVIDNTGSYIYMPPSQNTMELERYATCTGELQTLATAPHYGTFSHGAWKNGKLWIVLDNGNLYSYDPTNNTWSSSLHSFGSYANVAASGPSSNLIYVIVYGGAFYSYNVTNGNVTTLASHPYGFSLGGNGEFTWFGATQGFIYAMGGCSGTPAIYDIAGNAWHAMSDPKNNGNCAGHATYDCKRNRLYVTDGSSNAFYYQFE